MGKDQTHKRSKKGSRLRRQGGQKIGEKKNNGCKPPKGQDQKKTWWVGEGGGKKGEKHKAQVLKKNFRGEKGKCPHGEDFARGKKGSTRGGINVFFRDAQKPIPEKKHHRSNVACKEPWQKLGGHPLEGQAQNGLETKKKPQGGVVRKERTKQLWRRSDCGNSNQGDSRHKKMKVLSHRNGNVHGRH